jgi:hypothetical protein
MHDIVEDDDGFASCDEDEEKIIRHRKKSKDIVEEKTGDPIKDFYLSINDVKNKEDKSID